MQRSVAADWREEGIAELAREFELVREDAELANGATLEQLEVTIKKDRQLRDRVDQRQVEPDDWALLEALIREEMR